MFLLQYNDLLENAVRLNIKVLDNPDGCENVYTSDDTQFCFRMEKLQQLNLDYETSTICSLSFHAPKLEFLEVVRNDMVHLAFENTIMLRSVLFCCNNMSIYYPEELQSILSQAPKMTRLELTNCLVETTFSTIFGNLQTIKLTSVKISPTDSPLECLNLIKLHLMDVKLEKPLKIRVPKLHTLICDQQALHSLHLHDAFEADLLAIDLSFHDKWLTSNLSSATVKGFPEGFSSFRRLHILLCPLTHIYCTPANTDNNFRWLGLYLSGTTELTLQSNCWDGYSHQLKNMCDKFSQLNSVRLLGMEIPDVINFLPFTVRNVTIEDCSVEGSKIEFPPTVERVRLKKLWKLYKNDSTRMTLLPVNRFASLESEIVPVLEHEGQMGSRIAFTSKDCHEPDDMDNVFPLQHKRIVRRCQTSTSKGNNM